MPDTDGKRESATDTCLDLLLALFVLNIVDAVVTAIVVGTGRAEEVNIVPKMLLKHGFIPFLLVKLIGVSAALAWAWWRLSSGKWNSRIAQPVLIFVTIAMAGVVAIGMMAFTA